MGCGCGTRNKSDQQTSLQVAAANAEQVAAAEQAARHAEARQVQERIVAGAALAGQ